MLVDRRSLLSFLRIARAIALAHALSLHDRQPHGPVVRIEIPNSPEPTSRGLTPQRYRLVRQAAIGSGSDLDSAKYATASKR